jgi:hypothetical protein
VADSREILAAESIDELRQRVDAWYADAAAKGLPEVREPWNDARVKTTESGFVEFEVWAADGA